MSKSKGIALAIITVTYEDSAGLSATIESLKPLLCTNLRWEHIIVDGSPHLNQDVFRGLSRQWPLVYLQEPPRGVYAAMNTGIAAAKADFVWFLNSGDRMLKPENLGFIIQELALRSDALIALAGVDLFRNGNFSYPVVPPKSLFDGVIKVSSIPHQGTIYRRSVFDAIGTFSTEYRIRGDYEHFFRCFLQNVPYIRVPISLAAYDMDGISSNWIKSMTEVLTVRSRLRLKIPISLFYAHGAFLLIRILELVFIKSISNSPFGKFLRPLWVSYKKIRARKNLKNL
jgi:glycosyltransferase involved in cell wall biosynthesis